MREWLEFVQNVKCVIITYLDSALQIITGTPPIEL